jgi:hypothetical protein
LLFDLAPRDGIELADFPSAAAILLISLW